MSYHFTFDLSAISQTLFNEIAKLSNGRKLKINEIASDLVNRFKVAEITGLPLEDAIVLIKDMIDAHLNNFICKPLFKGAKNKALFLPHCSRKYMDSRCKAEFNTETSSYKCKFCSKDCLVYQATILAKKKDYDVFILPGGSCVQKILKKKAYDGVVGIACTDELKLGTKILCNWNTPALSVPLTKNGCSETQFNIDMLKNLLEEKDHEIEGNN